VLQHLRVRDYRCLRDVGVRFGPLTVFVGPNGSGKTALASVLVGHGLSLRDVWQKRTDLMVAYSASFSSGSAGDVTHSLAAGDAITPPYAARLQQLRPEVLRRANQVQEALEIDPRGGNLTNVFATLPRPAQERVVGEFVGLVPHFRDVYAKPHRSGNHRLVFQDRWSPDTWYEPEEVSDGSLLTFAYLLLAHQLPAIDMLVVEDPEYGLHPYLLARVIDMLRRMSRGELGARSIQVVLTTHSPSVLNHLEPEEVRFLTRRPEDGSVEVAEAPTDSDAWPTVYDEYQRAMGDLWLSGCLGAVPDL